ncbi:hypothetical protein [Paenibacillus sp. NPDC058071]|uniref:hypothetical protein n=1 Tax=Paenibacillus sp. NPDC058071 TaxID=3346326 RepID=UPI0036DA5010
MSRVQKHRRARGRRRRGQTAEPSPAYNADTASGKEQLPSRRQKFPSSAHKITKWYYNVLFILFVSLVAGLFWYGVKYTNQ